MDSIIHLFSTFLVELYKLTGDLGLALIVFTILIKSILVPLTIPSLKAQKQLKELQPELKKLKAKHGSDKQALQLAQLELYKKYNVNPLGGCLPQLLQIAVLLILYRALMRFLHQADVNGVTIDPTFLWMNLSQPDPRFVIPVLAAVTQFILSLMILPATETPDIVPNKTLPKEIKEANKKEEDMAEMAQTMQQQMVFLMPITIGISALSFPSGLGLYWVVSTVFSIVQQYVLSGPGGLTLYAQRALNVLDGKTTRN
ncbi:MAG TPA: YidC/Oxa1 family membrane protein insertase [Vitreimonas sp.]|nr:YidC/Oxa1 family membrane protein insertase [Vitreimonas sp.]